MMVMEIILIKIKESMGKELDLKRLYIKIQSHQQEMARALAKLPEILSGSSPWW